MNKDKRIAELEQENASLKEKNRFLRKQNKELWKRVQNNIIANTAKELNTREGRVC